MSKHTRSIKSKLRREQRSLAKKFMWDQSFQDSLQAETINLVDYQFVLSFLGKKYGEVIPSAIPDAAFSGCVLSDSRGDGAFQR